MKIFGQLIRTVVNVTLLPVAVVKDAVTLGGVLSDQNPLGNDQSYTADAIDKLKEEASECPPALCAVVI
jgi:hypothetical protein